MYMVGVYWAQSTDVHGRCVLGTEYRLHGRCVQGMECGEDTEVIV